jgi:hypothetical protein
MIDLEVRPDGIHLIRLPKMILALTRAELIAALKRAKAVRWRDALATRLAQAAAQH